MKSTQCRNTHKQRNSHDMEIRRFDLEKGGSIRDNPSGYGQFQKAYLWSLVITKLEQPASLRTHDQSTAHFLLDCGFRLEEEDPDRLREDERSAVSVLRSKLPSSGHVSPLICSLTSFSASLAFTRLKHDHNVTFEHIPLMATS